MKTSTFIGIIVGIALALMAVHVLAEKTFPIGKAIQTQAFMCFDKTSAVMLAKTSNDQRAMAFLINQGKCAIVAGVATYTKRVHEGDFDVWEVHFGATVLWESTNWKPPSV